MAEKTDFYILSIVAMVAVVSITVLLAMQGATWNFPAVEDGKSFKKQDVLGLAGGVVTPQYYCRCIVPGGGEHMPLDPNWDPELTLADVWVPPKLVYDHCASINIVSLCESDSGSINAYTEQTIPV